MFNRFIHWHKNIEPDIIYRLDLIFLFDSYSFMMDDIAGHLVEYFQLNENYKDDLVEEQFHYSDSYFGSIIDYSNDDFRLRIGQTERSKLGISDTYINLTSKINLLPLGRKIIKSNHKSFKYGTLYNYNISNWENQKNIGSYKYKGGISTKYNADFDIDEVDISDRIGRRRNYGFFNFKGASTYWFGNELDKRVNTKKFKQIKNVQLNYFYDTTEINLMQLDKYLQEIDKVETLYSLLDLNKYEEI